MKNRLLCLGYGYCAHAFSRLLISEGDWAVIGSTRSKAKLEDIRRNGVRGIVWPGDDLAPILETVTHLLISIRPGEQGDIVIERLAENILDIASNLKWVTYLSTTAVYGNHDGGWVNEDTPLSPSTERGRFRVRAEEAWWELSAKSGFPLNILRLAGIYGPGRGPMEQLIRGRKSCVVKDGQFFNRVHVDDIAGLLVETTKRERVGHTLNVCDDLPERPEVVISFAARLLGIPEPERVKLEYANLTPMARSFYMESKRVSNRKMKKVIHYSLLHPNYESGFVALANKYKIEKGTVDTPTVPVSR